MAPQRPPPLGLKEMISVDLISAEDKTGRQRSLWSYLLKLMIASVALERPGCDLKIVLKLD